jgi:hypothetical protein
LPVKPGEATPAMLNEDALEKEITETIEVCQKNKCPYEFVLKDISTVGYNPQNLINWAKVVMQVIDKYYS